MNIMAKPDIRDWTALPTKLIDYLDGLEAGVKGLRIAFSGTLGHITIVNSEITQLVKEAAKTFSDLGAIVEEVDPNLSDAEDIFCTHWFASAAAAGKAIPTEKHYLLDPGFREIIEQGRRVGAAEYIEAMSARAEIGQRMQAFLNEYDLLLTPGQPLPAFKAGLEYPDGFGFTRWHQWTPFTYPFNLTQQPAASVPCGFTSQGLPAGLQIVGQLFDDARVLQASRAYESACPFQMPDSPIIKN